MQIAGQARTLDETAILYTWSYLTNSRKLIGAVVPGNPSGKKALDTWYRLYTPLFFRTLQKQLVTFTLSDNREL